MKKHNQSTAKSTTTTNSGIVDGVSREEFEELSETELVGIVGGAGPVSGLVGGVPLIGPLLGGLVGGLGL